MKTINDFISEGIFDAGLSKKDFNPIEMARALQNTEYNEKDGSKDCLGQPLKKGDLILVVEDNRLFVGVYIEKRGDNVVYGSSKMFHIIDKYKLDEAVAICGTSCYKVIKIDPKIIKM